MRLFDKIKEVGIVDKDKIEFLENSINMCIRRLINLKNISVSMNDANNFLESLGVEEKFVKGEITREELTAVEDKAIEKLVEQQKKAGLKGFTDGEFRRQYWHLDFFWGLNGVDHTQAKIGYQFHDEITKPDSADVVGKITGENHPFVEHFKF